MSGTSTAKGPCPAYLEEVHEDSQTPISGSRQTANTAAKRSKDVRRSKRDGASDSGYSSRTAATTGSSSLESKSVPGPKNVISRLTQSFKMASSGKRSQDKEPLSSSKSQAKSISRQAKKGNLREGAAPFEGRDDAAKMQLSGAPVERKKSNAVHHDAPETHKAQPSSKTSRAPQSSTRPAPNPSLRRLSQEARSIPRPASYAGPHMSPPYLHQPPIIQQMPVVPPLTIPNTMYGHVYPSPAIATTTNPLPIAPNQQIAYAFPHTTPQHHLVQQPNPEMYYLSQPAVSYVPSTASRRSSTHGISPVEVGLPHYYVTRRRGPDYTSRRQSVTFVDPHPAISYHMEDEAVSMDEPNEAYYRQRVPQRPAMRHSLTASATVSRRADEGLRVMPSRSPQKQSFEEPRSGPRPSGLSRTPSTKSTARAVEAPMPPTATNRRHSRSRPMSYHEGTDAVRQAEAYQENQKGQTRHIPLIPTDLVGKTHRKTQKTNSKAGSESGSRTSTSRSGSGAKKRESMGLSIQTKEGMRVEYTNDGTIKVWRNHNKDSPAEMTVAGSRSEYRDDRSRVRGSGSERDKRYSLSVTHEPRRIRESGDSRAVSRHRSSTRQLVTSRDRGSSQEEHEEMIRSLRAELPRSIRQENPIEDEEESETAKGFERPPPMERVQRIRTDSRIRRSSRSTVGSRRSMAYGPVNPVTEAEGAFF